MENYYIPLSIEVSNDTEFSIFWHGDSYNFINSCLAETPQVYDYVQINSWGFTTGVGATSLPSDFPVIIGSDCETNANTITTANVSRSLFDVPRFTAFEPLYFALVLVFCIWVFSFCIRLLFGKGWK